VDTANDAQEIEAIKVAVKEGITHIDTAEGYGAGHTEELVGKAIKGVRRSQLFLTSKVAKEHHTCDGIPESCKKSLKRLGTSYLDLYLLHEFSKECPLDEAVAALDALVDKKLVKHIGVSNFTVEHLREAQKLAKHPIVCNQVYYNLQAREPESSGLLEYCQKNDVLLVAYRPVERGKLLEGIPDIMQEMCVKYQKTPAQVAINWLTSQENVVTIIKTSNLAHLKENLGGISWRMTEGDVLLLRKKYPGQVTLPEKHALG
jgi:diketogulonate reductase-like aldo/keto reductase